jgi:hypothetical protein
MAVFVRSPFGRSLRGTRDQARRMNALGYNVWLIRFLAILFSGFWTGVSGLLFVYYNQFISPQVSALTPPRSAADGDLRRHRHAARSVAGAAIVVVMKNVVSAYIERWNLVLGVIFVVIISFMPEGWCRARCGSCAGPGATAGEAGAAAKLPSEERVPMTALAVQALCKSFGGLRVTAGVSLEVQPGERRLIIGPERRRQDHAVQPHHRRDRARLGLHRAVRPRHHARAEPAPCPSRHGAHLSDHHAVRARHHPAQRAAGAARPLAPALESICRARRAARPRQPRP